MTLNVRGWVSLGESQILGLLEDFVVISSVFHLSEHVVGRSIDDTTDLIYDITGKAILQSADDGNATGDCRLVPKFDSIANRLFHRCVDLTEMLCDQGLVGRYDTLSPLECLQNHSSGQGRSSHDFDDNVDAIIIEDGIDVRNKGGLVLVDVEGSRLGQIPNANLGDDTPSGGGGGHLASSIHRRSAEAAHDDIIHAPTDGSSSHHSDTEGSKRSSS
mmetsp:Transcript_1328/g.2243  ORF Transcript_1328/g.2243 Transcript_1328/m.2243 type:complete len:217 (-) Transcript_1328:32-682(-)